MILRGEANRAAAARAAASVDATRDVHGRPPRVGDKVVLAAAGEVVDVQPLSDGGRGRVCLKVTLAAADGSESSDFIWLPPRCLEVVG